VITALHVSLRFFFAAKANEKRILTICAVINTLTESIMRGDSAAPQES
jgi:hypothetical protein